MVNVTKSVAAEDMPTVIVQYRTLGNNAVSAYYTPQYPDETLSEAIARALRCAASKELCDVVFAGAQRIDTPPVRVRSEREMTADAIATLGETLIAINQERVRGEGSSGRGRPPYDTCASIAAAIGQLTKEF